MKFFFSQMETKKEAVLVGTLNLIRAIVSADGEQGRAGGEGGGGWGGAGGERGAGRAGQAGWRTRKTIFIHVRALPLPRHYWVGQESQSSWLLLVF